MEAESLSPLEFSKDALAAANIHPETFLATDYLNHYNELVMLLDLLPDMPEMREEVVLWSPKTYKDHFTDTNFAGKDLAIAAYEAAPPFIRAEFDALTATLDDLFLNLIDLLKTTENTVLFEEMIAAAREEYEPLMARARSVVNEGDMMASQTTGTETYAQDDIDALFN